MRKSNLSNYTHPLLGTVPKNWKWYRINEICTISSGGTPSRKEKDNFKGNILWVTSGELKNRTIEDTLEKISDGAVEEFNLTLYDPETVIIAIYGLEAEGVRGTASILKKKSTISQACMAFANFQGLSNVYFYYWYLNYGSIIGKRYAQGTKQQNLSQDVVATIPICCPPLPEQQKIATILSTQDKVIELKEKLLVQKQQQKKYLMQQLLTGKKRLPGFGGEWKTIHLNEISCRIETKNTVGNNNVLTISAQYGLINQTEFFDKVIASDDKSNYYLLSKDEFAYNRSYSKGYPYGTIKRLKRYVQGVVSPLYICFAVNKKLASLDFLEQYFEASIINREIQSIVQEGARNHGMLNVAVDDFFRIKITMPEIEEQKEIAKILSAADHEIDLLQKSIEAEKQKKKALMQLLLTGAVRVK